MKNHKEDENISAERRNAIIKATKISDFILNSYLLAIVGAAIIQLSFGISLGKYIFIIWTVALIIHNIRSYIYLKGIA